jgi:predicted enzyme related to lactoylglutathione lyase
MNDAKTLRGLATARFHAADLEAAKRWYAELLGTGPYFERPGYAEFRIGDYGHELGLLDSRYARLPEGCNPAGAVIYWHVDDVKGVRRRLLSMGARDHEEPRDFGNGFVAGSVVDPFGNILGIMYSPHYLEVLGSPAKP